METTKISERKAMRMHADLGRKLTALMEAGVVNDWDLRLSVTPYYKRLSVEWKTCLVSDDATHSYTLEPSETEADWNVKFKEICDILNKTAHIDRQGQA